VGNNKIYEKEDIRRGATKKARKPLATRNDVHQTFRRADGVTRTAYGIDEIAKFRHNNKVWTRICGVDVKPEKDKWVENQIRKQKAQEQVKKKESSSSAVASVLQKSQTTKTSRTRLNKK
jgi:hypothetical protein